MRRVERVGVRAYGGGPHEQGRPFVKRALSGLNPLVPIVIVVAAFCVVAVIVANEY